PRKLKSVLTELIEKDSVNINVIQHIDKAENDNVKLIYDVDAFLNGNKVSSIIKEGSLFHFLYHDMQDAMFELFKSVVSEKYLEQCKQLKEKQIKEKQNEQND
ncbi:MAG: hypothetical protein KIH03_10425, partial [Paludibacteraceae bacterium]|nr:hypothetical protein [Paludibacteraceae bacterium]